MTRAQSTILALFFIAGLQAAAFAEPGDEKRLLDRIDRLEKDLQDSRARERLLEQRLDRLEKHAPAAAVHGTPAPYPLGQGESPASAAEQAPSVRLDSKPEIAGPLRDLEKPYFENGTLREAVLGGFDFQGFVDARFIFDENVLFDERETFNFKLHEVELDIIKRFPQYVFLRADIDFHTSGVQLEQGFAAVTLPIGNGLTARLGKFNSPIGTEPQDAPRAIFINRSMVHGMGLPDNFVGMMLDYPIVPRLKIFSIVTNGWDRDDDMSIKESKSIIGRLEWKPVDQAVFGLSGGIGAQKPFRNYEYRRFIVFDAIVTPHPKIDLTFDATFGSEDKAPVGIAPNGVLQFWDSSWWGGQTTVLYRIVRWMDVAGRYEIFKDNHGARVWETGFRTLVVKNIGTPILVNSFSGEFIVHVVPGTNFNIEYQYNRSAGQDFQGLDLLLNHQENIITFQLESAF